MITKIVTVKNKLGLHARPSALLVRTANYFSSSLQIIKDETVVDGKSIMGILTLAAECGTKFELQADGPDEAIMIQAMSDLFDSEFCTAYEEN